MDSESPLLQKLTRELIGRRFIDNTHLTKCGKRWSIDCKRTLWGVSGPNLSQVLDEALRYFEQYDEDGEYD